METMTIKFMYNGIKIDGKLYKGWFSNQAVKNGPCITFYANTYDRMPNFGQRVENESDSRTDYFEKDRIRFAPDNPFYLHAVNAQMAYEEKFQARKAKRDAKKLQVS